MRQRSFQRRLLAAFVMPALVLLVIAGLGGYTLSRAALEDELGRSLSRLAAITASQVGAARLTAITRGDDESQTRTYAAVHRLVSEAQAASGMRRIFVFDRNGRMKADGLNQLPVETPIPELARDELELKRVFAGEQSASDVLFEGSDGLLYKTGYAPVFADGPEGGRQVVGAVGVEGTADFFTPLRQLFQSYAALALVMVLVLATVALVTARMVTRPLRRLHDAAARIGSGNLETPVEGEHLAELDRLAQGFEQMRRELRTRDQQLQTMLAGVAHEVRNPLGGIELFAGLLQEELPEGSSAPREHVVKIRSEVRYLQRIVEDFLVFAREQKLTRESIDPIALLHDVATRATPEAAAKNVAITAEAQTPPELRIHADPSLLAATLLNLVRNAVQAAPSSSRVRLGLRLDGEAVVFEVQDDGSGIPPENQEKIFEPFFTTREKGSGLGLALARKVTQAHGGAISVISAPGQTVFSLRMPLR